MKFIEIGTVTKPHGLRGEVRVRLHWATSEVLFHASRVLMADDDGERWMEVESARPAPPGILLKFLGVEDRSAAETLRGARVSVARSDLPEPEPGECYLADLVGAKVETPGGMLGEVVEVRVHASVDSLVIRTQEGLLVEQPMAEPWILSIDAQAGLIRLASLDGLIR